MSLYKCEKCDKEFKQKSHYENHLNRKTSCIKIINNDSDDNIKLKSKENGHCCDLCGNIFSQSSSLYRHLKDRCPEKKKENKNEILVEKLIKEFRRDRDKNKKKLKEHEEEIKKLREELDKKNNSNTTINNTIGRDNNGIINNGTINIVPFGKEDLSHLTKKDWFKILNEKYGSIKALTEKTHFDKNKPEHHNLYISNIKSKYITYFDGEKWQIDTQKKTIEEIYDDKAYTIFDKFDELNDDLPQTLVEKFQEIRENYNNDDYNTDTMKQRKHLINELDSLLYNQRDIAIATRKKSKMK